MSKIEKVVYIKDLGYKDLIDEEKKIVTYESKTELEDFSLTDFAYVLLKDAINPLEYKEMVEKKDIDYYITFENIKYGISESEKGVYIIKDVGKNIQMERLIEEKDYILLKEKIESSKLHYYDIFKGIVVETKNKSDNNNKYIYVYEIVENSNLEYYKVLSPTAYYEFSLDNTVIRDNNWNQISNLCEGDEVNFIIKKKKDDTEIKSLESTLPLSYECVSATVLGKDLGLIFERDRKFTYNSNEYILSDYDYAKLYQLINYKLSVGNNSIKCTINKEPNYICTLGGILIEEDDVYLINTMDNSSSKSKDWSQWGEKITNQELATQIKEIFERSKRKNG